MHLPVCDGDIKGATDATGNARHASALERHWALDTQQTTTPTADKSERRAVHSHPPRSASPDAACNTGRDTGRSLAMRSSTLGATRGAHVRTLPGLAPECPTLRSECELPSARWPALSPPASPPAPPAAAVGHPKRNRAAAPAPAAVPLLVKVQQKIAELTKKDSKTIS